MELIIENALGSIRVGLEDYRSARVSKDSARLTSAVRNVVAGILLLAKGKLYEMSPAGSAGILMRVTRTKLVDGQLRVVPDGKKTINYSDVKQRFAGLGMTFDWRKVDQIIDIRNDLEHFYHDGSIAAVQQALAQATPTIRELLDLLRLDPVRDLGEEWWKILLQNEEVFRAEEAACRKSLGSVKWINDTASEAADHFSCQNCGSTLIWRPDQSVDAQEDLNLACRACGTEFDMPDLFERALEWLYPSDISDPPEDCDVGQCPECTHMTFVREHGECAVCDFTMPDDATCAVCGNGLSAEDYSEHTHMCSYHAHLMAKDD